VFDESQNWSILTDDYCRALGYNRFKDYFRRKKSMFLSKMLNTSPLAFALIRGPLKWFLQFDKVKKRAHNQGYECVMCRWI